MATLAELMEQRAQLDQQIEALRASEMNTAIQRVRALVAEFGLRQADVFGRGGSRALGTTKVPIKYRDPATGQTWTGRGRAPKWIEGQDRAAYAV